MTYKGFLWAAVAAAGISSAGAVEKAPDERLVMAQAGMSGDGGGSDAQAPGTSRRRTPALGGPAIMGGGVDPSTGTAVPSANDGGVRITTGASINDFGVLGVSTNSGVGQSGVPSSTGTTGTPVAPSTSPVQGGGTMLRIPAGERR